MLLRCLVLASFVATARCRCTGEWADVDTPDEACSSPSHRDGAAMQLVFSDEFDRDNRTFHDGSDTRWTALDGLVYTNAQINAYDSDLAVTGGGMLQLLRFKCRRGHLQFSRHYPRGGTLLRVGA